MSNVKFSPELVAEICGYLETGNNRTDSCVLAGISRDTLYEWIKTKPDISDAIKKAELICKKNHIENIQKASIKSWQASAWWLERKHHEEFGLRNKLDSQSTSEVSVATANEIMARFKVLKEFEEARKKSGQPVS